MKQSLDLLLDPSYLFLMMFTANMIMQVDDLGDLSEENLERKLRAAGGAHQPTSFDFLNESDNRAE